MELLVVIVIIVIISAVALPAILPALSHRQVSEAGRILQGALVGARDKAIHDGQPSGIRLIPDPAWPIAWTAAGTIDTTQPLAYSRIIPIGPAPEYGEGAVSVYPGVDYSAITGGVPYLVLEQAATMPNGAPNAPTSWFWNVRVGDKVQVNNAGPWYTVVGPARAAPKDGNGEFFVNWGPPGSPLPKLASGNTVEFLFLSNGRDDNGNGYVDDGWDGVDNNGNGTIDEIGEWLLNQGFPVQPGQTPTPPETETWLGALTSGAVSVPYTIRRRPLPQPGAREIALPTQMVIDATTWGNPGQERSRLPVNVYTGAVEIMINPDGAASPALPYGAPSSLGMGATFFHFWLAERQDVASPSGLAAPTLPIVKPGGPSDYAGPTLVGRCSIVTLSSRSGQIVVNEEPEFWFDPPRPNDASYVPAGYNNQGIGTYSPNNPFAQAQQGFNSGR